MEVNTLDCFLWFWDYCFQFKELIVQNKARENDFSKS